MKNEVDTTENNKVIAEFLGWNKKINKEGEEIPFYNLPIKFNSPQGVKEYIPIEGFVFDTDWNWLMEVVEKIESLEYNVEFSKNHCIIIAEIEKIDSKRITKYSEIKIKAVYNACVEFVKWYNENAAKR